MFDYFIFFLPPFYVVTLWMLLFFVFIFLKILESIVIFRFVFLFRLLSCFSVTPQILVSNFLLPPPVFMDCGGQIDWVVCAFGGRASFF